MRIQHLLSILKHKTNEKACEKCEFVITDGPSQTVSLDDDEERDSLESRLTVRLHCKHGTYLLYSLPFPTCLSPLPLFDIASPCMRVLKSVSRLSWQVLSRRIVSPSTP